MMRRIVFIILISGCLFVGSAFADPDTQIRYDIADLGLGKWQYTYEVSNISFPEPIEEFTIWFDYGSYGNLAIVTPDPPAGSWSEIVVQPEPVLLDDGFYDSLVLGSGLLPGESVPGFSVSFDWLGTGSPGSQFYEIIDPTTFETIESGYTVPEPATLLLLGLGGLALLKKRRV
jgi:hypothetical protein